MTQSLHTVADFHSHTSPEIEEVDSLPNKLPPTPLTPTIKTTNSFSLQGQESSLGPTICFQMMGVRLWLQAWMGRP